MTKHMHVYVSVNIHIMRFQCQFWKKKIFFQLLVLEEDCTLPNKKIGTVQRKVSEKLVMEASVVI